MFAAEKIHKAITGLHVDPDAAIRQARHYARRAPSLLLEMANPRGRCNRTAFLHIAIAFLVLQVAVAGLLWIADIHLPTVVSFLLNVPIFWIGTTVCIKRLHDVGRPGWWIPAGFAIWFITSIVATTVVSMAMGPEALAPDRPMFYAVFAAICLPAIGALLWVHTAPGMTIANRFGPLPQGFGLSMPAQSRRSRLSFSGGSVLA